MSFSASSRRPLVVGVVIGVIAVLGMSMGLLDGWRSFAADRFFLSRPGDASIVIVAIDDASIARIGRWPWSRSVHASVITKLHEAGARAIGYDVNFSESFDPQDDVALQEAIQLAGNVVLPVELTLTAERDHLQFDPTKTVAPLSQFASVARATAHANTPPDRDGVVRRIPLIVQGTEDGRVPAFAREVLRIAQGEPNISESPTDRLGRLIVNYDGSPGKSFRVISLADFLYGTVDPSALKDKVVFVGATASDLHDEQLVPTSNGQPMSGVEIHASLYDTLLHRRWLQTEPDWMDALILLGFGLFVGISVSFLRARFSAAVAFFLWASVCVMSFVAFDRGWIMDIVWPTITIIFAYAAVTLERRITADRERRELRNAFSRYVSSSVIESILRDPSRLRLGGDKRRMTVFFSDIRGFTSLSESLSPEALVEILNVYLTRMTDIVFEEGGVLDKYIGDAVMAFWNAPFDQPDHALRAVRTAIRMQAALKEMNASGAFPQGIVLKIGIGINTGEMVVGNMGSETRFDYTVIGDNVNLGARLEGVTKEYRVGMLMTEATRLEVGDAILSRRVDKVAVKGKKEPAMIYEIIALTSEATDADRNLALQFERALDLYLSRKFEEIATACREILATTPDDGPTTVLLERATLFLTNPPPPEWNGTWIMTKK